VRLIQTPVKRSKKYEATLQKLGGKESSMFPTLREALTFCAVLGYKERRRLPLDSTAGTEDIAGAQYQTNEAVDAMFALALAATKASDVLRLDREKECVEIYEEYANGGLDLVQSWIDRYADLNVEDAIFRGLNSIGVRPPAPDVSKAEVIAPTF
jgi:dnd system-associated protein 4